MNNITTLKPATQRERKPAVVQSIPSVARARIGMLSASIQRDLDAFKQYAKDKRLQLPLIVIWDLVSIRAAMELLQCDLAKLDDMADTSENRMAFVEQLAKMKKGRQEHNGGINHDN